MPPPPPRRQSQRSTPAALAAAPATEDRRQQSARQHVVGCSVFGLHLNGSSLRGLQTLRRGAETECCRNHIDNAVVVYANSEVCTLHAIDGQPANRKQGRRCGGALAPARALPTSCFDAPISLGAGHCTSHDTHLAAAAYQLLQTLSLRGSHSHHVLLGRHVS